jgi:uncharacterized protein (TIGR00725 family)
VLGSARLAEGSPEWAAGRQLGRLLAERGFTVVTGGYGGLMAAVSCGAAEAGGHIVGLPMTSWTTLSPNRWCSELTWADGYPARLAAMLACEAIVAMDGGIGTLSELAVAWAARQTEPGAAPVILIGRRWQHLLGAFRDHLVISDHDLSLVRAAATPAEAIGALADALASPNVSARPHG